MAPPRVGLTPRRVLAILGSLAVAASILLAVVVPEARVVVAPTVAPLGPIELTVRAGSGGEVTPTPLSAALSAKVSGVATGSRIEEIKATGTVQLQNKTTQEILIPRGTLFQTGNGVRFLTTQQRTLPQSVIIPPSFSIVVGRVDIPIEAELPGLGGNVAAGRITVGPQPNAYEVTNPTETTGGDTRRIPVVRLEDYDAAVTRAPEALRAAAEEQLRRWTAEVREGQQVIQQVLARQSTLSPSNVDVVGTESETFELTVEGSASAFAVPSSEPRSTAIERLRSAVEPENELDERGVDVVETSVEVSEGGVTWRLTARGVQVRRVEQLRIGRMLAGRIAEETAAVLRDEGLRLVRLERTPAWWPLLPVLDGRISIQIEVPPLTRAGGP